MKLFDSSPLIAFLGNLNEPNLLRLLKSMGYQLYIPSAVFDEIEGVLEKENLQELLKDKTFCLAEPYNEEEFSKFSARYPQLGKGEIAVIIVARKWKEESKEFCCILDDKTARNVAEKIGLKCKGTIGTLKKLYENGKIKPEELKKKLKTLEKCGFRYRFNNLNIL